MAETCTTETNQKKKILEKKRDGESFECMKEIKELDWKKNLEKRVTRQK